MNITPFEVTPFMTNCYVVEAGGEALVVDPGEATPILLRHLDGLKVVHIVNTHGHLDHCGGNGPVQEATGAPIACHPADLPLLRSLEEQAAMFGVASATSPEPDKLLEAGDVFTVGGNALTVRHAPGHSPGHVVLVGPGVAIVGDVLFQGSVGRTDLPGGSHAQLLHSIETQLLSLPDDTVVYPGHGPSTTIGAERQTNPFLGAL